MYLLFTIGSLHLLKLFKTKKKKKGGGLGWLQPPWPPSKSTYVFKD